jgi:uncharacterized protein
MTEQDIPAKPARALFSYWATFAWAFGAFIAGQVAGTAVLVWWLRGGLYSLLAAPYDGATVTLSVFAINPVMVAVLMLAVRLRAAGQIEYFALVRPRMGAVTTGIVGIIIIIALTDAYLFLSGHAIVSTFQSEAYTSAASEGWLALLWVATVLVAPAGEEITFRGFLFRGFVRSDRTAWPAIVVISLLWASLHLQYDWTGIAEIFVAGLFLGWVRWRSGSTLLTFLLHSLFNIEGMVETVLQVKHLV